MSEFDINSIPVLGQSQPVEDTGESVLSPNYRARDAFGGQQIGGLVGGLGGSFFGPVGSTIGSGVGGATGETYEQVSKGEPIDVGRIAKAGGIEAAWDAGGNLVIKGLGKVVRLGSDAIGFTQKEIPDANKAAQAFLEKQGSSLPMSARTGSNVDAALEGLVYTPATYDIFKGKQEEIRNALHQGQKDVLSSFSTSDAFKQALKSDESAQLASGVSLQNFIKQGQEALSAAYDAEAKKIFAAAPVTNLIETTTGGAPKVSMFELKNFAQAQLANPETLTAGQRTVLNEIKNLPPTMDFNTVHQLRSRWLAENRDKYAGGLSSEKDSKAAGTITSIVGKIDSALDFSAGRTLPKDLLDQYRKITDTYREGIQGLNTDAVVEAMKLQPEKVGAYLFQSGNETPIKDLHKALVAASGTTKQSSSKILNDLRVGYLDSLTHTPENMLTFAKNLEQDKAMQNTFNMLFRGTEQEQAIKAMNEAAKKGLVQTARQPGLNYRTAGALINVGGGAVAIGTGYAFLLSPEQQERIKDNLGTAALAGGSLVLTQRQLAKVMLDPKGAKALTYLSTAKDKLSSPTAFTKLVVEPLNNLLNTSPFETGAVPTSEFDINSIPVK